MKERGIIFSGPMVRAILEGRKTMTRRVVKPQAWAYSNDMLGQAVLYPRAHPNDRGDPSKPIRCPYGIPGDWLYVREAWRTIDALDVVEYRADKKHIPVESLDVTISFWWDNVKVKGDHWRPSIHMPKWAARTWLEITEVRVERVQEITEADAILEGCGCTEECRARGCDTSSTEEFIKLWDSLNAKRGYGWKKNPWVWCISFRRIEK